MPEKTEYRGLRALEYAAQTGAQLMRQRPLGKPSVPISNAIAHALWTLGAEEQIFCVGIDHVALASALRRELWQQRAQRALQTLQEVAQLSRSLLGALQRSLGVMRPVLGFVRRASWPRFSLRPGQRVLP